MTLAIASIVPAWMLALFAVGTGLPTYRNRKVGGIRFVRIGRVQMSFCVLRKEG